MNRGAGCVRGTESSIKGSIEWIIWLIGVPEGSGSEPVTGGTGICTLGTTGEGAAGAGADIILGISGCGDVNGGGTCTFGTGGEGARGSGADITLGITGCEVNGGTGTCSRETAGSWTAGAGTLIIGVPQ